MHLLKKYSFFYMLFLGSHLSYCQRAVVSLPELNIIYAGLDNPITIAVEGYKYSELAITTFNCKLTGTYPNIFLRAHDLSLQKCSLFVSYMANGISKTDTINFRIFPIPPIEAMFGTLSGGSYPVAAVLAQNSIIAVIPDFVFKGIFYKVTSYSYKFVSKNGLTECSDTVNGRMIPNKLKQLLRIAKSGDKLVIDSIKCIGSSGDLKTLKSLEYYIDRPRKETSQPNLISYQKDGEILIKYYPFQPIYGCHHEALFSPGILRLYHTNLSDSLLMNEIYISTGNLIQYNANKIIIDKDYYASGKIKNVYNFETNDTMGTAIKYYENGKIMSTGNIIVKTSNIFESLSHSLYFAGEAILSSITTDNIEKYIDKNYAPIGQWKGFDEDGNLLLDCSFKLQGYANLYYEIDTTIFVICGNHEVRYYPISTAIKNPKNHFYPMLSGPCKIFNSMGELISQEHLKE